MQIADSSRVCVQKLPFRKTFLNYFLVLVAGASSAPLDTNNTGSMLTLKEAVTLGMANSLMAKQLIEEEEGIDLRQLTNRLGRMKQSIGLGISNKKNKISDVLDLESSVSNIRQYSATYNQMYQNGLSLSISHNERRTLPNDPYQKHFRKFQVQADMPIWGRSSRILKYNNQKQEMRLGIETLDLQAKRQTLLEDIINTYLDFLLTHQELSLTKDHLQLLKQKYQVNQNTQSQLSELERQILDTEIFEFKYSHQLIKVRNKHLRIKIGLYLGDSSTLFIPVSKLEPLPKIEVTMDELVNLYLGNAADIQKQNQQVLIKQKEMKIARLDIYPDISIGGFGGISISHPPKDSGENYGGYISLKYNFLSGHRQSYLAAKRDLKKIEYKTKEMTNDVILQAKIDYNQLQANLRKVQLFEQKKAIAAKQEALATEKYRTGQASIAEFTNKKIQYLYTEIDLLKSQTEYWRFYVKVMDIINRPISLP